MKVRRTALSLHMSRVSSRRLLVAGAVGVVALVGLYVLVARMTLPSWMSDQRQKNDADAAVLRELDLPSIAPPLVEQSSGVAVERCTILSCYAPSRHLYLGCTDCAETAALAAAGFERALVDLGWVLVESLDEGAFRELEISTDDSSTGRLVMQVFLSTGSGFLAPSTTIAADGSESEIWIRISPEGFG
jgi:hypothetical protein